MDSDIDESYEDMYEEEDGAKQEKLVHKVLSLNKIQNLKKPSRTEPTLQISEFSLVKSITGNKGSVQINELTKPLKSKKSRVKISENVNRIQKSSKTLPKPLEKPQANRIRRAVAYEKTRLQLDRWEPTVTANRVSTNLNFPLDNNFKMEKKEAESFASMWRVKSKLEEELEKHEPKVDEFHISLEEDKKFPLTMKEMLARRKEAAKLRAYQGYKEAKARRQNKIKSKKYHRIQKRERIKQKLKEFEQLQKTNPEEALKKLEEIEKTRVEERFSLRHKSTGKWARNQQIRAKYDKESRQVLAEQLILSKELTQKLKSNESESEEEMDDTETPAPVVDEDNPWVNGMKPNKEVVDFISGYRKYWTEKNKNDDSENKSEEQKNDQNASEGNHYSTRNDVGENNVEIINKDIEVNDKQEKRTKRQKKKQTKIKKESPKKKTLDESKELKSTSDWEVSALEGDAIIEEMFNKLEDKLQRKMLKNVKKLKQKLTVKVPPKKKTENEKVPKKIDLSLPIQKKTPQIDEELIQETSREPSNVNDSQDLANFKSIMSSQTKEKEQSNIDPNKYLNVKTTKLSTAVPDILTEENEDAEVNQRHMISEAFEDDDIVDEFNKEKKDEIEKDKPKDINLSLPGWGSWGGANIKVNKRKKRRFTVKAPAKVPRRDDNKGSLIINEKAQTAIKEHLVSEVPFPFKTVKDFEASMRAPIGNTFVPETAYKRLIKPAVTTKLGTIIEPMSKDVLLNKSN